MLSVLAGLLLRLSLEELPLLLELPVFDLVPLPLEPLLPPDEYPPDLLSLVSYFCLGSGVDFLSSILG